MAILKSNFSKTNLELFDYLELDLQSKLVLIRMGSNFNIRKASFSNDLDTLIALVNENNGKDIYLNYLRLGGDKYDNKVKEFIDNAWVYEIEGQVIGCVAIGIPDEGDDMLPEGWKGVECLTVHPSYQGQGIGTKLMDWVEGLGDPIMLAVYEPHERVKTFYRRRGYTEVFSVLLTTWIPPDKLVNPDVKLVIFKKDVRNLGDSI